MAEKQKRNNRAESQAPASPGANIVKIRNMLAKHIRGSVWLRSRAPLIHELSALATSPETSDTVRIRALERIEELLEKAEDEKRRKTFGGMEESIEASLRRAEAAIRRGGGD